MKRSNRIEVLPHTDPAALETVAMFNGLAKLQEPFPDDEIEKLPRATYRGAWEGKQNSRCDICHGRHPRENVLHLDYVGHAGVTRRLLEVDPLWNWEPLSYDENGLPRPDAAGGMWIKLTVCGVTRLGYGNAEGKRGGDAVKEVIGDAIRNAAMRFGVALDLWSKSDRAQNRESEPDNRAAPTRRSGRQGSGVRRGSGTAGRGDSAPDAGPAVAADTTPPDNEDAVSELASVCDENGLDVREVADLFARQHDGKPVRECDADTIRAFTIRLIEQMDVEPDTGATGEGASRAAGDDPAGPGGAGAVAGDTGAVAPADDPGKPLF